ncbi:ACP S-malonyltransferase [Natranaerofaba carboxydovora]|uniref:ACP S-malonyltransferase n=1 Tax=Natranaerofaba carboxydovora TaxID=2742683 RepID=UPI001F142525|nr:ACP S-malonyltransferase [Natranaerofaba carboxydovora]UMZ73324.1 Malonyl CoA-acyl carrier protein transacylase [Natranaerofaba carboxydovora]
MSGLIFLFPGQGAQFPGMGSELVEEFETAKRTFKEADEILGFKLSEIILNGEKEDLMKTEITQPAILTVSIACMRVLAELGLKPEASAGLSLGEYSALVTAGSIEFEDALPLVKNRGKFMQEAVPQGQGKMLAVIGGETEKIEKVCEDVRNELGKTVRPVNYNCPGQIVIAGEAPAVDEAGIRCKEQNAKKVIELSVSAPFHSEMLEPASDKLAIELEKIEIKEPKIKVLSNVTGDVMEKPEVIRKLLTKQVKSPVLWEQSMRSFLDMGYKFYLELPPGSTLTSFMRKIDRKNAKIKTIEDPKKIEQVKSELSKEGIV